MRWKYSFAVMSVFLAAALGYFSGGQSDVEDGFEAGHRWKQSGDPIVDRQKLEEAVALIEARQVFGALEPEIDVAAPEKQISESERRLQQHGLTLVGLIYQGTEVWLQFLDDEGELLSAKALDELIPGLVIKAVDGERAILSQGQEELELNLYPYVGAGE